MNTKQDDLKVKVNKERNDFMYITETTENVRKLIEKIESKDDITKLKFLIYIFGLLNNNQINDRNEANPDLIEDEDINIFTLDMVGLSDNACSILLEYYVMLYNKLTETSSAYMDNGNVFGIDFSEQDKILDSQFEKLNFNEKLDVFSEIIIRYDNETYFEKNLSFVSFDTKSNGFDIAKMIKDFKI